MNIRKLPLLLASASLLAAVAASAGEPLTVGASRHEAEFAVNMLQSSYSKNWNGGDKG